MKYVYIVKYRPNCEEDYIMFISQFKKNCNIYLQKLKKEYDKKSRKFYFTNRLYDYYIIKAKLNTNLDYL